MSGNSFVSEDWSGIFNCGANIKILRLRVVGRNEKESGWVLVIHTGRIHETARAGRLKGFWQLPNLKRAEIFRQGHKIVFPQETDHFCLATFVRLQERLLIGGDVCS